MAKHYKKKVAQRTTSRFRIIKRLLNGLVQCWQKIHQPAVPYDLPPDEELSAIAEGEQNEENANALLHSKRDDLQGRKWDVVGVCGLLIGSFTFLGSLSQEDNGLLGGFFNIQYQLFGWGAYGLPVLLFGLGFWIVWRNKDNLPALTKARLLGVGLLWFNLLGWLHYGVEVLPLWKFAEKTTFETFASHAIAILPGAGGYISGMLISLFYFAFGVWGTAILLIAWLIIALALSFDVSVAVLINDLTAKIQTANGKIRQWLGSMMRKRAVEKELYPPAFPITSYPSRAALRRGVEEAKPEVQTSPLSSQMIPQWRLPSYEECLESGETVGTEAYDESKRSAIIEETLESFGAPGRVVEVRRGPTVTQFGVEPQYVETRRGRMRVRVSKIAALADDLALALAAKRIRIQAPVPGKSYVGIEVPNDHTAVVHLRDVIRSPAFQQLHSPLRFALGANVSGDPQAYDLAAMPHLLIAGATGSGKSVCVNSIISCFLLFNTPQSLRLLMIDPKRVELSGYNGIPHLLAPVIVDIKQVTNALQWVTREMDRRYHIFAEAGVRSIREYNQLYSPITKTPKMTKPAGSPSPTMEAAATLPYWVVIIDELADLMMLAAEETERSITRLAQLARATGIHLILATQRPSVDVVTGVIKANFPARIAFAVASSVDSRVIIDQPGAERLLGSGDMLFQAPDAPAPLRLQGVYVSDREIQRIVHHWRSVECTQNTIAQAGETATESVPTDAPNMALNYEQGFLPEFGNREGVEEDDPLLNDAVALVRQQGRASASMLQRRLRIGYTRAARLMDLMEERGIVSQPHPTSGLREVLDVPPSNLADEK